MKGNVYFYLRNNLDKHWNFHPHKIIYENRLCGSYKLINLDKTQLLQ